MEAVDCCELCGSREFVPHLSQRDLLLDRPEPVFQVVRCRGCALLLTNPRPSRDEIGNHYPDEYPVYAAADRLLSQLSRDVAPSRRQQLKKRLLESYYGYPPTPGRNSGRLDRIVVGPLLFALYLYVRFWRDPTLLPFIGDGRILDVGCGPGFALALYRELGWHPTGVELAPTAARYAREVLGVPVHQGELIEARFPSQSFDVVLFRHALEHMPAPLTELREAHRILGGPGLLVVTVPNAGGLDARLFGRWWIAWDLPRHLYHFTPRTASALLGKAGFRVERVVYDWSPTNSVESALQAGKHGLGGIEVPRSVLRLAFLPISRLLAVLRLAGNMTIFCTKA